MIAEAGAAIGSIKVAMELAKGISALKSETEINQAIIDIQRILLEAQTSALGDKQSISQLRDQISTLQSQVEAKQNWVVEQSRYVLTKSQRGVYFYGLKSEFAVAEVEHRLCATCFESGKKSILHTTKAIRGGEHVKCLVCNDELQLTDHGPLPPIDYGS